MEYMAGLGGAHPFQVEREFRDHVPCPSSFIDKETESQKGHLPKAKQLRETHWTAVMDEGRAAMDEEP